MKEILSCRVTLHEKLLVQAWAAQRGTCVAHLLRDCVLRGVRGEFGISDSAVEETADPATRGMSGND